MSIYDLLKNYKTTPAEEIRKINDVLDETVYIDYFSHTFLNYLKTIFKQSEFNKFDSNYNGFIKSIVFKDYNPNDFKKSINQYRYYCEFLLNLCNVSSSNRSYYINLINRLKIIIETGLNSLCYKLIVKNGHILTSKIDDLAEGITATIDDYNSEIMDYLLAKTIDEKENALIHFSIKLEALKSKDNYIKSTREYVQLLRHKTEKQGDKKYQWFFSEEEYEMNLEKLFKIFLSTISYYNAIDIISEFKTNCERNE